MVLATSDYTRNILNKLEFELFASRQWKDCLFGGEQIFGDVKSELASAHLKKIDY
jgi:hypothetical protein